MNPMQHTKVVRCLEPGAIKDNVSWPAVEIDTLGFDSAQIIFNLGATDVAMVALKLTESDTSGSGYGDVSGADFNGNTDMDGSAAALPAADDDNKFEVIDVDLRKRKRYLKLTATAGDGVAGTYAAAFCILSGAREMPNTCAERGAEHVLQV